jgi:hypothetical protein
VYLGRLDADAIPAIVAAMPKLPPADRASMRDVLEYAWSDLRAGDGWPAWNVSRERAREALLTLFAP